MIWVDGAILPDDGLRIASTDRAFEHGLGLFETLRTWGGVPTLLESHKARMLRSAGELGLPVDPASWPDAGAVRALLEAEGATGDRLLRVTATGGTEASPSVVWMRSAPLPAPVAEGGASLLLDAWKVAPDDALARHKSLNYWSRRRAWEAARRLGLDEALSGTSEDVVGDFYYEGSRSNLFLVLDWGFGVGPLGIRRPRLLTTSEAGPIVPGILRALVLEVARELPIEVEEVAGIDASWLDGRGEVFLTNAVRGIVPVGRAVLAGSGPEYRWEAPGRWTARLVEGVARRLWPEPGGNP